MQRARLYGLACALGGMLLAGGGCREEAAYPSRPLMLICPWSPGGGTDRVARQIAVQLEGELKVPVNVVNATGGGGVTGHTRAALARPDGYTLAIITPELNMLHWRGMTNVTYHDFQPLLMVNRDDAALFVRRDAPWQTIDQLNAEVQAKPKTLRASGTAFGGIWHVALAGWLDAIGSEPDDVTWISINGAGPSLQELIAGGVQIVCCSVPEAQTLLDAGEVRCLAVMGDARSPAAPAAPTLREVGVEWSLRGWRGIALPPGVPEERAARLQFALERIVASDDYRTFLESSGFGPAAATGKAFEQALAVDDAQYGVILSGPVFQSVGGDRLGPYAYPLMLAILLQVAVAVALIQSGPPFQRGLRSMRRWAGARRSTAEELNEAQGGSAASPASAALAASHALRPTVSRRGWLTAAAILGWIVLYMLLAETLGFLITASLLMLALYAIVRVRWWVAVGAVAIAVPLVYQVFGVLLRVSLPWGYGGW